MQTLLVTDLAQARSAFEQLVRLTRADKHWMKPDSIAKETAAEATLEALPLLIDMVATASEANRPFQDAFGVLTGVLQSRANEIGKERWLAARSAEVLIPLAAELDGLLPADRAWIIGALAIMAPRSFVRIDASLEQVVTQLRAAPGPVAQALALGLNLRFQVWRHRSASHRDALTNETADPGLLAAVTAIHPWLAEGEPAVFRSKLACALLELDVECPLSVLLPIPTLDLFRQQISRAGGEELSYGSNRHWGLIHRLAKSPLEPAHTDLARLLINGIIANTSRAFYLKFMQPYAWCRLADDFVWEDEILRLALALDDVPLACQAADCLNIAANIGTVALLLRAGASVEAARLLRTYWRNLQPQTMNQRFDDVLAAALPDFLDQFDLPAERLVAEAWILGLPDAVGPAKPATARSARLTALARRGDALATGLPVADLTVLGILASDPAACDLILDRLTAAVGTLTLEQTRDDICYNGDKDPLPILRRHLWGGLLGLRFVAGDAAPFTTALAAQGDGEDHSDFRRLMVAPIVDALHARLRANPVAFAKDSLPIRVLSLGITNLGTSAVPHAAMCLLVTGRSAEVKTWYDGLDDDARQRVNSTFSSIKPYLILGSLVRGDEAPLKTEADAVVVRILTDPVFITLCGRVNMLSFVRTYGDVIPDDRLAELGPRIATKVPNGGRTWAQLAEDLAKLDQTDASLEAWAKAVAAVDDNTRAQAPDWTLKQCQGLAEAGRVPEALVVAHNANTSGWCGWEREKLASFITQWGGSAKPDAKPGPKSAP